LPVPSAEFAPLTRTQDMRRAGKDLLSLELMASRNRTLAWLNGYAQALAAQQLQVPVMAELNPPLWEAGHVAWFQEAWIARNVQRQRGAAADPTLTRLASVEPQADDWYDSSRVPHDSRWTLELPDLDATRQYLADTLDVTLELLAGAAEDDASLYFYRLALFHEDMHAEAFAYTAQTLGLDLRLVREPDPGVSRPALLFPSTRWMLGADPKAGGFVFDNEKWGHEVAIPEFEIDAQAVTWGQYAEFVEDGGYEEERFWSPDGWAWLQREARRTPRHVEQIRHGVLQRRFGRLMRVPAGRAAVHVSAWEAEAWCRWAGRRLPTEVEWEAAAHLGASRGFRWGEVWEWTASTFRPWVGFAADPYRDYSEPWFGSHRVLRGASWATPASLRNPRFRNFYKPDRDDIFCGFRSCAR
jgi:gamma-glutamyl hercynylcysteine S-oxide synthase